MTVASKTKKDLVTENHLLNERIKELEKSQYEREKRADLLREQEEKYRTFFNTYRDCVFITSVDGQWLDLNSAAVHLFAYSSREELLNVQVQNLYANPDKGTSTFRLSTNKGIFRKNRSPYGKKTVQLSKPSSHPSPEKIKTERLLLIRELSAI